MRSWFGVLFTGALLLEACSDAGTNVTGTGGAGGGGGAATSSATTGSGSGSTSSGAGKGGVVINEISAKGDDWIELANSGDSAADLGGHGLCDSDALGACNLVDVVRFPAGTTLAPGARLLIVGNKSADAGVGPFSDCLATGGPSTCFYASWKVSASKGEKVHYVGPDDAVLTEADYPMNAVLDGQTWGRLPDLTGDFAANKPTAGAANAAP